MWPADPSASSSTRLARPFQTLRTTVVPSYSTQVVEPVKGRWRRLRCVFQVPISKSKSCCPSRTLAGAEAAAFAASGFCAANAGSADSAAARHETRRHPRQSPRLIMATPSVSARPPFPSPSRNLRGAGGHPQDRPCRSLPPLGPPQSGDRLPLDRHVRGGGRQVEAHHRLLACPGGSPLRRPAASDDVHLPQGP